MSKEIKDFGITHLTLGATCNFHKKVKKEIDASGVAALHVEEEITLYEASIENLRKVVNRQMAFAATVSLAETDEERDYLIGVINGVVNAHLRNPLKAKREAAVKLSADLAAYAGIARHEYTKQSSEVEGMLAVLARPEDAAALTALSLDEEVEALRAANEAFEAAYDIKITESTARNPQREADSRELREAVNAAYQRIVKKVNAYALIQPTDEINDFIERVNGIVALYANIAGGSASGGDTTEDPTTPGEGGEGEGEDGKDDEGTDLPFEPTDPNPDEGGEEEETLSVV